MNPISAGAVFGGRKGAGLVIYTWKNVNLGSILEKKT